MEQRLNLRFSTLFWYTLSFLFGVSCLGYSIFIYWEHSGPIEPIAIVIIGFILLLLAIPSILLPITFLYTDLKKQVFVDKEKGILRIRTGLKDLYITSEDVLKSYHVRSTRVHSRRFFVEFEYVLLILDERKRVFITGLLAEPNEIVSLLSLDCQEVEMYIPFLDIWLGGGVLTKEERERKTKEYRELFQSFPNNKLQAIIRNHEDYTDMAREAAKQLLKER